jgi:hypothetical protein
MATSPDTPDTEIREILDGEIARLPEKYRLPVVLCYLHGRTYAEAAEELGCPPGTVSGRLARARQILRRRLRSRGLTLSAAAVAGLCPARSLAASLVRATTGAACGGLVSARATALANGVLQSMKGLRRALFASGLLCLVGLAVSAALAFGRPGQPEKAVPQEPRLSRKAEEGKGDATKDREVKPVFAATVPTFGFRQALLSFTPDGKTLFCSESIRVCSWNLTTQKQGETWEKGGWDLGTHPRKGIIAGVRSEFEGGGLLLLDAATGKVVRRMEGKAPKHYWREQFALSEDGELLALGEMNFEDQSSSVRLWQVATGKELAPVPQKPAASFRSIALTGDRQTLAMGALGSHDIELHDLKVRARLQRIERAREPHEQDNNLAAGRERFVGVTALAFSADGRLLAAGNNDGGIDLWDFSRGKDRGGLRPRSFGNKSLSLKDLQVCGVGLLAFSRDGKTLFALDGRNGLDYLREDRRLRGWDVESGKERDLPCKDRTVHAFALSPDGNFLALVIPGEKSKARIEVWRLGM